MVACNKVNIGVLVGTDQTPHGSAGAVVIIRLEGMIHSPASQADWHECIVQHAVQQHQSNGRVIAVNRSCKARRTIIHTHRQTQADRQRA